MKQYYTAKQIAKLLNVSERRVADWRQKGILKSVRTGKGFMYREDWIDDMMTAWEGYDLSSSEAIELSMQVKKANEKAPNIHHDQERRRPS